MWECIDRLPEECDYFQVFRLENLDGIQRITHSSEQPEYRMEYFIPTDNPITAKVYIIDSNDYDTIYGEPICQKCVDRYTTVCDRCEEIVWL